MRPGRVSADVPTNVGAASGKWVAPIRATDGVFMYTLFYLLGYLAILGFLCLAFMKIRDYIKSSPLHVRWEIYPIPHEGPERAAYGGSYMEEGNWWTKPRHVDHWMDIKAMLTEILFLESTFENNRPLWVRTYPFHLGLYLLMGGTMILVFSAFCQLFVMKPGYGFMIFLGNIINATVMFGSFLIAAGGIALIIRRTTDKELHMYTTREMYFNLGAFVVFALLSLMAWVFNPSYFEIARRFILNLLTANFRPLGSTWFVLSMLAGFVVLIWIPITNMKHLLIKYFMYHDIKWGDTATVWSKHNQETIPDLLKYDVTWSANHVTGQGEKDWGQVATTNPATSSKPE